MNTQDLPEWLVGAEAITWLATGNTVLTQEASKVRTYATSGRKLPVSKDVALRLVKLKQLHGIGIEGTNPKISEDQRDGLAGKPEGWAGGWWEWLRIRAGSDLNREFRRLYEAVCAGKVKARFEGKDISRTTWRDYRFSERFPNVLLMSLHSAFLADNANYHDKEPEFSRDEVLRLRAPSNAQNVEGTSGQSNEKKAMIWLIGEMTRRARTDAKRDRDTMVLALRSEFTNVPKQRARELYSKVPRELTPTRGRKKGTRNSGPK
jgi:hypothetical protein